jgi:hypothetical protein
MAGFNAKKYAEENPIQSQIAVGDYKVTCEQFEAKTSSTGFEMLTGKIRVIDSTSGAYINALQWENLVIGHPTDKTRKIANNKLAEIMLAAGVDEYDSIDDLNDKLEDVEFTMSIRVARSGRFYAMYRPVSFFNDAANVQSATSDIPDLPPAPPLDYDDDVPY